MLGVRHDTFPLGAGEDLGQLILDEVTASLAQYLVLGDVYDVLELFLVDSVVVVHISFVAHGIQPVQMQVQVEVPRDHWHSLEDLECLDR